MPGVPDRSAQGYATRIVRFGLDDALDLAENSRKHSPHGEAQLRKLFAAAMEQTAEPSMKTLRSGARRLFVVIHGRVVNPVSNRVCGMVTF